jgi:hypothetical protein
VLDVAVWMSGDVSILHGETNITIGRTDAERLVNHLSQSMGGADAFAERIVMLVMGRINAKLFDHPEDRSAPSPFSAMVGSNKFASFLHQPLNATPITTAADRTNEPAATEATGLPGVELDGPGGINLNIPIFGRPPEAMTREEQFTEAAGRG